MADCLLDFEVMWPPTMLSLRCELELFHDGPHESQGFVWGYKDQSRDPVTQRRRQAAEEAAAKRRDKTRSWWQRRRNRA